MITGTVSRGEQAIMDDALAARYAERGIPTRWEEITPASMAKAYRLWYRGLPSPTTGIEGSEEAERLIHNPLAVLREAGIIDGEETPRISTMVVSHEKTLERFIIYATVAVSTNPSTVGITLLKEEE
jgi:hypothetical protein